MDEADGPAFLDAFGMLAGPVGALPPAVQVVLLAWCFVVGACVGSFLNVVIARVPLGLSIVKPRSRCPKCEAQIGWQDNIPLLSWVVLRAKCRSCAAPISARYPFVELLVALAATAIVARYGVTLQGAETFAFVAVLVAVAFVDMDTWTIPYSLVAALLLVGFLTGAADSAARLVVFMPEDAVHALPSLLDRAIGAAGGFALLGSVVVVATGIFRRTGRLQKDQTAMGWGDPLLLAGIGSVLGWQALPIVVFLASLQGALVGVVLRASGRLQGEEPVSDDDDWVPPKNAVPFGPFLAMGAIEHAFFGDVLLGWVRALWIPV